MNKLSYFLKTFQVLNIVITAERDILHCLVQHHGSHTVTAQLILTHLLLVTQQCKNNNINCNNVLILLLSNNFK
jgi:hypothetical protein